MIVAQQAAIVFSLEKISSPGVVENSTQWHGQAQRPNTNPLPTLQPNSPGSYLSARSLD
jgi:hypothetical protein